MFIVVVAVLILLIILFKYFNKDYLVLSLCKRIKTKDDSPLEDKVCTIPGTTVFGNNFDILGMNPERAFEYLRKQNIYSKGKAFLLYFLFAPVYNITRAEDAEEALQSQDLITKSVIYQLLTPFLGDGLLISSDKKWHFRRKVLTPSFHFNILQTFNEIFKEESYKVIKALNQYGNKEVQLVDIIPQFTLNNVCETALGVKLDNIDGSEEYRHTIHKIECIIVERSCNPLMYYEPVFRYFGDYKENCRNLKIAHEFSSKVIERKRQEFRQNMQMETNETKDHADIDVGKKQRYAMLDTLLAAEVKGQIDHAGICDEVNTFMFEGYDTTSTCLTFTLLNLALHVEIQEKCFKEIEHLAEISELSVFDFNSLMYLECVIKESLRLYPPVPFMARQCMVETELNGLILPANTQVNVHTIDIMRDERHFPNPTQFNPDRFLPENTTTRHPFAFIPFSAGPRNCIGQKFAMLEIKVLLVAILKNFQLEPVTRLEDIIFGNGLVLRAKPNVTIKFYKRTL